MVAAIEAYGVGHTGVLFSLAAICLLMIRRLRIDAHCARSKCALGLLSFCCFAAYPINLAAWASTGASPTLEAMIPLHLCDVASILCGLALVTRRDLLCELSYFWGLAGTFQGLITPNLPYDFPHPVFFSFFLQHGVVVITALILPLGLGWRPRAGAGRRAFCWLLLYACLAFLTNSILGTNFGFLMRKPTEPSLLDLMPGWPWYVLFMILVGAFIFLLLSLPFKKSAQK